MISEFGSLSDPDFLPSPRQCMRQAVEIASSITSGPEDFGRAALWIAIAAELRAGTRLDPSDGEVGRAEAKLREAGLLPDVHAPVDERTQLDYGQRFEDVPVEAQVSVPLFRDVEATQVIEDVRCINCLAGLVLVDGVLVHRSNKQRVCPVQWQGGEHTFAEPNPGHE